VRITAVDTFPLRLPAESVYLGALPSGAEPPEAEYYVRPPWRSIYSHRYETMLVRLEAEDGTAGWGEALAPVGPEIPAQIVELLLRPALLESDADRPRPVTAALRALMRERGHLVGHQADALAAVDTALWDLAARVQGVSVVSLLGGAFRQEVPTYVSGLPRPDDAGRAALAREWADRGARAVKLHLGHGVADDLRTVDAVRGAAPTLNVAVDAHWAYSLSEALRLSDGLVARGAAFLEAPLPPEDIRGHARLVARSGVPIAVGESLRNRYEFEQWLDAGALQVAQPDVARTGITELMAIAELCSSRHVCVAPHHSVCLSVAAAAGVAVSAAIENLLLFEYQPTSLAVGAAALGSTVNAMPNTMAVPAGPGLGVEVDRTVVEHLRKESER
jgi:D-galactarolactone cycloisomerase